MGSIRNGDANDQTRTPRQEVVARLGRDALETDDLDRLLHDAAVAIAETLETEYAAVLEMGPDGNCILRQGVGWNDSTLGTVIASSERDSLAEYMRRSTDPVHSADLRTDERFRSLNLLTDHGAVSGISVAIGPVDEPWGVLGAYATERRTFTDHDTTFVQTVANVLASATEAERIRSELEETYGRISDAVFALDADWRFTYLNERAHELINPEGRSLVGEHVWDVFPAAIDRAFKPQYERALNDQETVSFEAYYPDPLDSWFEVRAYPSETGLSVYFRDVTDRKARDAELRQRERQQRAIADVGRVAVETDDLDELMHRASRIVAGELDHEYCKVLELDPEARELLVCQGVGWRDGIVGSATVDADVNSQAGYTLRSREPVSVEDLESETRFRGPDLLTSHDVVSGISTIIGSVDEPWGIFGTHDTERRSYTTEDVTFVQSVAYILAEAIERHQGHLAALTQLNGIIRQITDAVIDLRTREEIYRALCQVLVECDDYEFAWVAEVDPQTGSMQTVIETNVEGALDDLDISAGLDEPAGRGPISRAIRTQELQVTNDVLGDPTYEPWGDHAREFGYRSLAVIPLCYEGTLYAVLGIHVDHTGAFEDEKGSIIGHLSDIVGHAIAAVERKQALMSETVTEVELLIPDVLNVPGHDGRITFDRALHVGEQAHLVFGTATPEMMATVETLLESVDAADALRVISEDSDAIRFELRTIDEPLFARVAAHGGTIERAYIENGTFHLTLHLPTETDVRRMIERIQEAYPDARPLARRQRTCEDDGSRRGSRDATAGLTSRQRTALETAYYAGFFEWPREQSGEDVAERLEITPPTFHEHLRSATKGVLESIFDEPAGDN
ncbi:hypothetical protein CV102_21035 [Natronococcus pandeyae]|uniref:PAS domain-containing protein n=1 Tax=Natronococcus pandeyae TaxID=2055836 RepID=A0A8J8Q0L2_9EURY|nr:GAF domain-containing protein [Natronococcus pandeyae]TYL36762.1 hypothetical protein CV102_21035 [Natronococcus pandeyae]